MQAEQTREEIKNGQAQKSIAHLENHIVIVGGGFGGIYAAKSLLQKGYKVTLVSQTNYFVFTPLLPEVATGSLQPNDITFEYSSFFNNPNFTFFRETITAVDFEKKLIRTADNEEVFYDYLILSTGAKTNFFGTKGSEFSLELKSIQDAQVLKKRIVELAQGIEREITINLVGGGPTGVELTLELDGFLKTIQKLSSNLKYKVRLIHSENSLCPVFPKWIQNYALAQMEKRKVEVRLQTFVSEITEKSVITKDGEVIPGDLTIWSAGVAPKTEIIPESHKDARGNILVEKTLRISGQEKEFAVGDMMTINGEVVPKLAQTAMHQGNLVARNIHRAISGKQMSDYVVRADNQLISLGKGRGAAHIFGFNVKGFFGWFLWRAAYLSKIPGFRNKLEVSGTWFINLFAERDLFEK